VQVPTGAGASLAFNARWNLEDTWDFTFVQVSTDGGSTYTSVPCTHTRSDHNPDAVSTVVENVPGFTGDSAAVPGNVNGWTAETCSLSAYAGQTVLLAFRAVNDPVAQGNPGAGVPPGFWVDDITLGGTLVSDGSSVEGWQSSTQARPTSVEDFTVYLLSVRERPGDDRVTVRQVPLTSDFVVRRNVERFIDKQANFVAAIVIYDESTEAQPDYAPYLLTVNGVKQPGGGM
jgi:Immune inhibitor A peptidase M6